MIATKWPRLLVVGKSVSEEQADEILIRTDRLHPMTNDRFWERVVWNELAAAGAPREPDFDSPDRVGWYRRFDDWRQTIGCLELSYLGNERIASSWFGGPHGWCDWDGTIGCSTWNIGKWPSTDEVTEDWTAIAAGFPFLDLIAQLVEEEGEGGLCGEWRVRNGTVEYVDEPTSRICEPGEITDLAVLRRGGERGVTVSRLRGALDRVVRREDGESQ